MDALIGGARLPNVPKTFNEELKVPRLKIWLDLLARRAGFPGVAISDPTVRNPQP
jgi:hypothetical protein